jgi:hypothetical protein
VERRGRAHRLRSGMILPSRAFDRIDDPAEWYAPGMVFLALDEHGAETILGREDFAAELDGLGRIWAREVIGHADMGRQIPGGRYANRQLRKCLNPLV